MYYKLNITEEIAEETKEILSTLQYHHIEKMQGIKELYDNLIMLGRTESYAKARIYYVAYTLAERNIDFEILESE